MSLKAYTNIVAAFIAAIFICNTPLSAQPIIDETQFPTPLQELLIDLDKDGMADRLRIYPLNNTFQVLSYEVGSGDSFDAHQAFIVPINLADVDSLKRTASTSSNSFTLTWGCFTCGRYHSEYHLTLRLKKQNLQIIGYDQSHVDRMYAAPFSCSVNLITGKTIIQADDVERLETRTPERTQSLQDYNWDQAPKACDGLDKYDEAFMAKHFGDRL